MAAPDEDEQPRECAVESASGITGGFWRARAAAHVRRVGVAQKDDQRFAALTRTRHAIAT
jgi:hypothetical protein